MLRISGRLTTYLAPQVPQKGENPRIHQVKHDLRILILKILPPQQLLTLTKHRILHRAASQPSLLLSTSLNIIQTTNKQQISHLLNNL